MSTSVSGLFGAKTRFPILDFIEILFSGIVFAVTVILLLIAHRMALPP